MDPNPVIVDILGLQKVSIIKHAQTDARKDGRTDGRTDRLMGGVMAGEREPYRCDL